MQERCELPKGWAYGNLADIAEINPPVHLAGLQGDLLVTFLSMSDISESGRIESRQAKALLQVKSGFTRFIENDVLFAKITPCMENGKGAIATDLINGYGFGSTEFHVLRARKHADARYIYHVSMSASLRQKAEQNMTGSAGQQRVPAKFFHEYTIPIPPLTEQRKIAHILTTLDDLIEQTEALIAKYQAIKQGMLYDLLTRGVDAQGHLRPSYDEAPALYKESPLGWIPKEWDTRQLCQIVPVDRPIVYGILMPGYGYPGGVPVIKVKDIKNGMIDTRDLLLTDPKIDEQYRRSRVQAGDLLFTIRGTVGRTAFVPFSLHGANITQDTARITIKEGKPDFVRAYLSMSIPRRFIEIHTLGVAVQGINLRDVRRIPLAFPSLDEQQIISERITAIEHRVYAEQNYLNQLNSIKIGLMQDLLTGQVRVTVPEPED